MISTSATSFWTQFQQQASLWKYRFKLSITPKRSMMKLSTHYSHVFYNNNDLLQLHLFKLYSTSTHCIYSTPTSTTLAITRSSVKSSSIPPIYQTIETTVSDSNEYINLINHLVTNIYSSLVIITLNHATHLTTIYHPTYQSRPLSTQKLRYSYSTTTNSTIF